MKGNSIDWSSLRRLNMLYNNDNNNKRENDGEIFLKNYGKILMGLNL